MHMLTHYARSVYLPSEIAKPGGGFERKKQVIKRYITGGKKLSDIIRHFQDIDFSRCLFCHHNNYIFPFLYLP